VGGSSAVAIARALAIKPRIVLAMSQLPTLDYKTGEKYCD